MWWHTRRNRFRLSAKWTIPFKSVGASVQSTTGSRGVRVSGSNAGYTMFRVRVQDYWLPTPLAYFPFTFPTVRHRVPSGFNWALQCFHIFLRPFNNYIIFFLQLPLSFQSSSINPFSPISPLIPTAQVSLGLPRFLLPHGHHIITSFDNRSSSILWTCPHHWSCLVLMYSKRDHTIFIFV